MSIDGGGIKGVFPASFLAALEDAVSHSVADYFDLLVGTSTGGIIALGLGLGYSARELLAFYEEMGPRVFRRGRFPRVRRMLRCKHESAGLEEALRCKFGDRRLGESTKRLVIPSMNLETGEVFIYKTAHHPRLEKDYRAKAVDVALATASAPTYFPAHRSPEGVPLIDGGTYANNPVGLAVVEAIGVLGWSRESLRVLSLGCTVEALDVGKGRNRSLGLGYWAAKLGDVLMLGQSSLALGMALILAGHDRVERICPVAPRGRFRLDTTQEIESLRGLGFAEARRSLPRMRELFLDGVVEEFRPHRRVFPGDVGGERQ